MSSFRLIRDFWRKYRKVLEEQYTGFTADVWLTTNKTLFETQQNAFAALKAELGREPGRDRIQNRHSRLTA